MFVRCVHVYVWWKHFQFASDERTQTSTAKRAISLWPTALVYAYSSDWVFSQSSENMQRGIVRIPLGLSSQHVRLSWLFPPPLAVHAARTAECAVALVDECSPPPSERTSVLSVCGAWHMDGIGESQQHPTTMETNHAHLSFSQHPFSLGRRSTPCFLFAHVLSLSLPHTVPCLSAPSKQILYALQREAYLCFYARRNANSRSATTNLALRQSVSRQSAAEPFGNPYTLLRLPTVKYKKIHNKNQTKIPCCILALSINLHSSLRALVACRWNTNKYWILYHTLTWYIHK